VGDFQVVREIGRGGMGVVCEAVHTRLQRRVALKMIKAGALAEGREREMFRKEALAVASLQHPNIVQLFELGEHEGQPFLVLEYVGGGSLDDRLASTPIDPHVAAQLVATLARAIHYAHERGIIHRDLKPANILLGNDECRMMNDERKKPEELIVHRSSFIIPKITDFGLAKHLHAGDGQTQSGVIKGTPSYMAPEQVKGGVCSAATDVYALGAILYETLTGRPPFRAATTLDTLMQVTALEPVPPSRLQPKVPRDLETICLKCLHKEPARRYSSAQELAEELERFLRHEPIQARPVGMGGRLWRWCRRNPVVAALLSLATSLAVLVLVLLVLRLADERATRERILAENVFAANHLANTILVELWKAAEVVERVASDPELLKRLKADQGRLQPLPPDDNSARPRFALPEEQRQLQPYLEGIYNEDDYAFHSWHVIDKDGILLADVPPLGQSVFGVAFPGRDYFAGALRHAGKVGRARVHVSRAYQSASDRLFKITLSAVVYDEDGKSVAGVVCATLPTDASLGLLELTDAEHTAVLVGPADVTDPHHRPPPDGGPIKYLVLVHPAYGELADYGQGKKAAVMPQAMLPLVPHRDQNHGDEFVPKARSVGDAASARHDAYEDPLGAAYPSRYGGQWLAGFAQVGNTEMVVIVQRRHRTWAGVWYWLLLGAGGLLATSLVVMATRHLRRRRVVAASPPADSAATVVYSDPPRS
jgi:serine/threonine-protein kinase